ncbi:MAG: hypothetical protein R3290_04630 [Acidimicrobiia bacterium]|nr:hypothetical protein [Acidimicrobiia bacterium]
MHRLRLVAVVLLLALAGAACGDDGSDTTTTTESATTTTAAPAGAIEDEVATLVAAAERVRGLEFLDEPTLTFLTPEELAERIRTDLSEDIDPDDIADEEALLELLGLIGPDLDLLEAYTSLYAEQVAAFYDPDTREMVVGSAEEATPLTRSIVVHELIHALVDQHYGFGAELDRLVDEERFHEATALQALVEGDATYFQIVYLQSLPSEDQLSAARESLLADTSVLDSLPPFMGRDLAFPYDSGFRFVERVVADLGLEGVDQAYRRPPTTTEQIIDPDRWFTLEPGIDVELDVPLPGWDVALEGTLGQWNLGNYLLAEAGEGVSTIATDGWGGDAFEVLRSGDGTTLVYRYVGDTPRDAAEVFDGLVASLGTLLGDPAPATTGPGEDDDPALVPSTAVFDGRIDATVERLGADLVLVVSTDVDVVQQLAEALSFD